MFARSSEMCRLRIILVFVDVFLDHHHLFMLTWHLFAERLNLVDHRFMRRLDVFVVFVLRVSPVRLIFMPDDICRPMASVRTIFALKYLRRVVTGGGRCWRRQRFDFDTNFVMSRSRWRQWNVRVEFLHVSSGLHVRDLMFATYMGGAIVKVLVEANTSIVHLRVVATGGHYLVG